MLIPIGALLLAVSIAWMAAGIRGRSTSALLVLTLCWGLGAVGSAYGVWLAWQDRGHSENWAAFGFLFFSLPYALATAALAGTLLFWTRKWEGQEAVLLRRSLLGLLAFLLIQLTTGLVSL